MKNMMSFRIIIGFITGFLLVGNCDAEEIFFKLKKGGVFSYDESSFFDLSENSHLFHVLKLRGKNGFPDGKTSETALSVDFDDEEMFDLYALLSMKNVETTQVEESSAAETSNEVNPEFWLFQKNTRFLKIKSQLRKAASRGDSEALANLAYFYLDGRKGYGKNHFKALNLCLLSADQGNALGQSHLGYMYRHGLGGLKKDEVEAVRLYRLSADQGNALGQSYLGYMYLYGLGGLKKDKVEAVRLYRLSAEQGNVWAQKKLRWLESR